MAWLIWLGIAIAMLVVEAFTVDLIAIWFAVAGFVSVIITAIFPDLFYVWQILIFVVLSAVLVLSTRNMVKKFLKRKKDQETNLELVINHRGRVVDEIYNDFERGEVKINGIVWSARTKNGEVVEKDALVTVLEIRGNKLIVEKFNEKGE
jgi:membrane protein implicated in regulation of membrane protease activity